MSDVSFETASNWVTEHMMLLTVKERNDMLRFYLQYSDLVMKIYEKYNSHDIDNSGFFGLFYPDGSRS